VSRQGLIIFFVAALAAAGGYFAAMQLGGREASAPASMGPPPGPQALVGKPRPDFELQNGEGAPVSASEFDGRPLLLNFWATWCQPCVEEMPMLDRLQREQSGDGLQVVGIAVDEPSRARDFADELGLGYPLLFGTGEAMLAGRRYGNASGMLPFSVLIDADGIIRWTHLGALERQQVEAQLAELAPE
jgi:peroxiredoxin